MASASLTNFTVPLASDQSSSTQGLLMPKLKYRFRVTLQNFGVAADTTELTKQVIDFTRPSASFNPFVIDVYNSKVNLVGKPEWEAVTLNLRDDVQGQVSLLVGQQIQRQFDFMEQSSAASGQDYKFITLLEMLDGGNGSFTPTVLETWELDGCLISNVNWGDLNYSQAEAATIQLQIKFDNAIQGAGEGVGVNVGRTTGSVITA